MNLSSDSLFPSVGAQTIQVRRWLLLGVIALGVAGLFAGVLGNTRSDYFYTALVVHVDLSVLVWFLAMACLLFSLACKAPRLPMLANAAFGCFAAGTLCIALSAFTGGEAYMSNYIPVIHHPVFFVGLSLLLCGVLGSVVNLLLCGSRHFGVTTAAWIMLIAAGCFVASQQSLPAGLHGQIYYEYAFWGGGHVLQFAHTQFMLVCWLWLAVAAGLQPRLSAKAVSALYAFGLAAACVGPFIYWHPVMSDEHRTAFTMLMKHANGLAPLVAGAFIVKAFFSSSPCKGEGWGGGQVQGNAYVANDPHLDPSPCRGRKSIDGTLPKITLLMSILLFAAGGALGYLIAGSNVTVPAHYHGSIVGITLAFMGVAYLLLPSLGFADVSRSKLALLQPLIYGGGQLCWMTGMAMLGAHGVPRKTPGSADTMGALASALKHSGDGLALIGGLLFVFIVLRAVCSRQSAVVS